MRAKDRTAVCFMACLFLIGAGGFFSTPAAVAQGSAVGLWMSSEGDTTCPLFALEILENGEGEAWTADGQFDPIFSDLAGKVSVSGGRIESSMAEGGAGIARMSLRGTISGNRINAQVTVTEGRKRQSGPCVLTRQ